jgi:hypothetical protein
MLTDTFAGIAPSSTPAFILMQLLGTAVAIGLVLALYPDVGISTALRARELKPEHVRMDQRVRI